MLSSFLVIMSKFGPLNRLAIWISETWSGGERAAAGLGKRFTLVELFSRSRLLNSPGTLRFLAKYLDRQTVEDSAMRLKVADNSKLLFYSKAVGNFLPKMRFWDLIMPAVVLGHTETYLATFVFAFGTVAYWPLVVSASRLFVVRMDLVPHMEAVMVHKVGIFGTSRVEVVPVKSLVRILPKHSKHDYYFRFLGGADLLFKDTQTGEEYAFDKNGIWIDENLKHTLIA
jgi:hypothetical protein